MDKMEGCHICEGEDEGLEAVKARITFIANLDLDSPMGQHVVAHVREGGKRRPLYAGHIPPLTNE